MSNKITIISDVHISDYPAYENYRFERLSWYKEYANEVIAESAKVQSKILFIAGDLFDRSSNPPEIQNAIREVINAFDDYFDNVYYINGQHDLKTKDYDSIDNNTQSAIHAMAPSRWIYAGKTVRTIHGRTIACMDFNPEPDLSWITDKVDLFIGHVTINTSGFGSDIDYNKFTLGIAGDIHYPCKVDNLHSVGVGVPRYLGDSMDGSFVICDLSDLSFNRIKVDPNNLYMTRYVKVSSYDDEGPSIDKLLNGISPKWYGIYSRNEDSTNDQELIMMDDSRGKTVNEIIDETIKINNLEEIHGKVLNANSTNTSVDLKFKLISLRITNIRSIADHKITFDDKDGVLQIIGQNGSGKSAIIWSLNYALRGGLDIRNEVREGEEMASVYLEVDYQGKRYGIYRGTDTVSLDINGEYQSLGGKKATEASIREYLPFIDYIDSYFFADDSTRILGNYSAERRIELLNVYYRLDLLQKYKDIATELSGPINSEMIKHQSQLFLHYRNWENSEKSLNDLKDELTKDGTEITSLREVLEKQLVSNDEDYKKAVIDEENYKKADKFDFSTANIRRESLTNKVQRCVKDRTYLEVKIKNLQDEIDSIDVTEMDREKWKTANQDLFSKKQSFKDYNARLAKLIKLRDDPNATRKINCPSCSTEIVLDESEIISPESINDEITDIINKKDVLTSEINNLTDTILLLNTQEDDWKRKSSLTTYLNEDKNLLDKCKYDELKKSLDDVVESINNAKSIAPPKVSSRSILEKHDAITSIVNKLNSYEELLKNYESYDYQGKINAELLEFQKAEEVYDDYNKYINLFTPNGDLYRLIVNRILERFSSNTFKYEAVESYYRGNYFTDIVGYYRNSKMPEFREYSHCSNGQRTLLDLDFIRNLVTEAGLIVFDDFLGYLTTDNLIEGLRIIHGMKPKLKIITSQNDNSIYVNHNISLEYNGTDTVFM